MTRAYSLAFKQKMVERLTGKNALNQSQLAREMDLPRFGGQFVVSLSVSLPSSNV